MVRNWFSKRKKERGKTKPEETAKSTIYFATKTGVMDDGTGGGLFTYRSKFIERNKALDELGRELKTSGFSYNQTIGIIFEAESEKDAKNKLLEQKNNIVTEDIINKIEEKWIQEQIADIESKKPEKKDTKEYKEYERKRQEILEKYSIPSNLKKKWAGKTGIEIKSGINVDYDKATKGIHIWKTFKS